MRETAGSSPAVPRPASGPRLRGARRALRRLGTRRYRRGFSLFGVLLGLGLAAVVIVGAVGTYNAARESANRSAALTLLSQLRANIEAAYAGAPSYGNNADLVPSIDRRGGIPGGARVVVGSKTTIRHPFGGAVTVTGGPGGVTNRFRIAFEDVDDAICAALGDAFAGAQPGPRRAGRDGGERHHARLAGDQRPGHRQLRRRRCGQRHRVHFRMSPLRMSPFRMGSASDETLGPEAEAARTGAPQAAPGQAPPRRLPAHPRAVEEAAALPLARTARQGRGRAPGRAAAGGTRGRGARRALRGAGGGERGLALDRAAGRVFAGWVMAAHRATQAHADAFETALQVQVGLILTVARLRALGSAPPGLPERPGRQAAMVLGAIPDGTARGVPGRSPVPMAFGVLEPAASARPSAMREGALEAGLAALAPGGGTLMDAHKPAIEAALGRPLAPRARSSSPPIAGCATASALSIAARSRDGPGSTAWRRTLRWRRPGPWTPPTRRAGTSRAQATSAPTPWRSERRWQSAAMRTSRAAPTRPG